MKIVNVASKVLSMDVLIVIFDQVNVHVEKILVVELVIDVLQVCRQQEFQSIFFFSL